MTCPGVCVQDLPSQPSVSRAFFTSLSVSLPPSLELANAKASEIGLRFKRALDKFQSGLGKYSAEIQGYAQEVAAEVSEQGQKVQTETAKYQWYQDRAAALQAEYVAAFATPQPQGAGR